MVFSMIDVMLPFRNLLKSKEPFKLTQALQLVFEDAKEIIAKKVQDGIQAFNTEKVTCMTTDWSKTGIVFTLMQNTCSCKEIHPRCCKRG